MDAKSAAGLLPDRAGGKLFGEKNAFWWRFPSAFRDRLVGRRASKNQLRDEPADGIALSSAEKWMHNPPLFGDN